MRAFKLLLAHGDLAQMVERSLSMREALGSMPRFSRFCVLLDPTVNYSTGVGSQNIAIQ